MRIFLDANILFSAVWSDGAVRRLVSVLAGQGNVLIADEFVLEETPRNLEVHASRFLEAVPGLLKGIQIVRVPPHAPLPPEIDLVEKDRPVLASAVALGCHALLTGDKTHFGHLFGSSVSGVEIHSPRSIAERLLGDRE